jgi:asparagine synthase (glutamine-hydrolysing)
MSEPWDQRYLQYLSFFTDEEKRALYKKDFGKNFLATSVWYSSLTEASRHRASSLVDQALAMDFDSYLPDDLLPKVDLGTMAHGLEARSPLLDTELLELTACMPDGYKLRGRTGKWIFRRVIERDIPKEILKKPKTGFRLPLDRWFRGDLKPFVHDRLLSASSPLTQYFDRTALEKFLKHYEDSHIDYSDHVWSLLWLDEWLRQYAA